MADQAAHLIQETLLDNPWIPHEPTPKQAAFLALPHREALFGGAAGGGKSDALLMGGLQFATEPDYAAIILRRTFRDLDQPDAIMARAKEWLSGTSAQWNDNKKRFTFPRQGSTKFAASLTFGYLDHENDKYSYQGAAAQYVAWDELTQFAESPYRYLFSRMRRRKGSGIPIRMRAATNPGGVGHDWVMQRFLIERNPERIFIPSKLDDNPHLDRAEYIQSLSELDPFTLQQLLNGDWFARPPGTKFRREWFEIVDEAPADARSVRYWDLAATEPKPGKDPDWTAGALVAEKNGVYFIRDMQRARSTPQGVENLIRQTAALDGRAIDIFMEQEPGSSGVNTIDHYQRTVLMGYAFRGVRSTGNKEVRANPMSSAAQAGNVKLVRGIWITAFLDEAVAFPGGAHDDQIDGVSGAIAELSDGGLPYAYLRDDPVFRAAVLPATPAETTEERIARRRAAQGLL